MGSIFGSTQEVQQASELQKEKYYAAIDYFEALKLPDVVTGAAGQNVFTVNFDGTGNNRVTLPGEKSNVALLYEKLRDLESSTGASQFDNVYKTGVGTEARHKHSPE